MNFNSSRCQHNLDEVGVINYKLFTCKNLSSVRPWYWPQRKNVISTWNLRGIRWKYYNVINCFSPFSYQDFFNFKELNVGYDKYVSILSHFLLSCKIWFVRSHVHVWVWVWVCMHASIYIYAGEGMRERGRGHQVQSRSTELSPRSAFIRQLKQQYGI